MLPSRFLFDIPATEDRPRPIRPPKAGIKRIFRLGTDRQPARQVGRR